MFDVLEKLGRILTGVIITETTKDFNKPESTIRFTIELPWTADDAITLIRMKGEKIGVFKIQPSLLNGEAVNTAFPAGLPDVDKDEAEE